MIPRAVGIDLSLTSTGIAFVDATTALVPPKSVGTGTARIDWLERELAKLLVLASPRLAIVEAAALHSPKAVAQALWRGPALLLLYRCGVEVVEVNPGTLKKFATGRGDSDKTPMRMEAYKRAHLEFATDDECDAWWLLQAALAVYCDNPLKLPKDRLAELTKKVAWPVLEAPAA